MPARPASWGAPVSLGVPVKRSQLLGALVPLLAVAVILTRGGGGMQGEAKGGKAEPWVEQPVTNRYWVLQVEQQQDWTQFSSPALDPPGTWIRNSLGFTCSWDIDDAMRQFAGGDLNIGEARSLSLCMVNDQMQHWACHMNQGSPTCAWWSGQSARYGVIVTADSPDLTVTTCYQPNNRCFVLSPALIPDNDPPIKVRYRYAACLDAVYSQGNYTGLTSRDFEAYDPTTRDPLLQDIPGSEMTEPGLDGRIRSGVGVVQTITTSVANSTGALARNVGLRVSVDGLGREATCVTGAAGEQSEGYPFKSWPVQ